MNRWASRKFWSAMVWQVMFTGLLIKKHLTPEVYHALSLITLGGYFVSNVMDKKFGGLG